MVRRKKVGTPAVDNSKKYFGISELSKEFNVTPRTIRHYEDEGLIEPARKGQQRLFTEEDRSRLEIALLGKRLGINLAKLRELFDLYDSAKGDDKRTRQLLDVLAQQRAALQQQQLDLARMTDELARMEQKCSLLIEKKAEAKRERQQQDLFG